MKIFNRQFCKKLVIKYYPILIILMGAYLLIAVQFRFYRTLMDIDTWFHYNRFYDISEQFSTHHFSYFQTNFGFERSGRVINAVYGPLFAYVNGLFVYLLGNWFSYQVLSNFILAFGSGIGMYFLGNKAKVNKNISTLLALLYMNIGSVQSWLDHGNMSGWGAIFAPFVLIEGLNMLQDHQNPVRPFKLMLIMSLLIQTHVLNTIILTIALIPFFIVGVKNSIDPKNTILQLCKAIGGTIALTANVWGAILLVLGNNKIVPNAPHTLINDAIHYTSFGTVRHSILAITALVLIFQCLYGIFSKKEDPINLNRFVSIEGAIFLFISSSLFPWKLFQNRFSFLANYLQFPHRLTVVAYPLLLLGLGLTIKSLDHKDTKIFRNCVIAAVTLILVQNFATNYARLVLRSSNNYASVLDNEKPATSLPKNYSASGINKIKSARINVEIPTRGIFWKNSPDMTEYYYATHYRNQRWRLFEMMVKLNTDYLPEYHMIKSDTEAKQYYIDQIVKPSLSKAFNTKAGKNGQLIVTWDGKRVGRTRLPLIMYKQSRLTLNGKVVKHLHLSAIGAPTVKQQKGRNTAVLAFIIPIWFKILFIITVISWIILIGCSGRKVFYKE